MEMQTGNEENDEWMQMQCCGKVAWMMFYNSTIINQLIRVNNGWSKKKKRLNWQKLERHLYA